MRRRLAALVVALLVAAACSSDGPAGDEARLRVDGSAVVTTPDGDEATVTDEATVSFDDTVTLDEGTGTLELADGSRYELRSSEVDSRLVVGAPPELLAGAVLVADGFPAAVAVGDAKLTALGALRVDAQEELAAAYTGRTTLAGISEVDELIALRQVLLSPLAVPEPLVYDGNDAWDRRFLGDAVAFGERLEALARGYTNDLQPGEDRSARFFESVIPTLADEREFNADLLEPDRSPGETLIGAAIAVQGREDNFRDRWQEIFEFREAGAVWGLVALDQGVSSAPVLETIELALSGSPLSDEPRPSSTTTTSEPPTDTSTPAEPTTSTTTSTTTTTTQPPDDDDDDEDGGILGPILDPEEGVVDDLLDSLGLG